MKRTLRCATCLCVSLLVLYLLVGCAAVLLPVYRITRDDIAYATEHGCAVVEAEVGAGKPNAVGTRSEGHGYPLRVMSVLQTGGTLISQSFTYDYSKVPLLRPGRYVVILQGGPYYRAERVAAGSARIAEIRQWAQHNDG